MARPERTRSWPSGGGVVGSLAAVTVVAMAVWLVMPSSPPPAISPKPVLIERVMAPAARVPARRPCVPAEAALAPPTGSARMSCLLHASAFGLTSVVQRFIAEGVDPSATDSDGNSPLMLASAAGQLDVVRLLLADRRVVAGIGAVNEAGELALAMSLRRHHAELTAALITAGAGLSLQPREVQMLAERALATCNPRLLEVVAASVHPSRPDGHQDMRLSFAAAPCRRPVLAAFRRAWPVDDAVALAEAARRGNLEAVDLLLAEGASPDAQSASQSMTPLAEAILHFRDPTLDPAGRDPAAIRATLLDRLLAAGADPDRATSLPADAVEAPARDEHDGGDTPLMLAAAVDALQAARLLLARLSPAAIDRRNAAGHTALMIAARHGHRAIVDLLLAPPGDLPAADKTLRNRRRESAADLAEAAGHQAIARLLRQ